MRTPATPSNVSRYVAGTPPAPAVAVLPVRSSATRQTVMAIPPQQAFPVMSPASGGACEKKLALQPMRSPEGSPGPSRSTRASGEHSIPRQMSYQGLPHWNATPSPACSPSPCARLPSEDASVRRQLSYPSSQAFRPCSPFRSPVAMSRPVKDCNKIELPVETVQGTHVETVQGRIDVARTAPADSKPNPSYSPGPFERSVAEDLRFPIKKCPVPISPTGVASTVGQAPDLARARESAHAEQKDAERNFYVLALEAEVERLRVSLQYERGLGQEMRAKLSAREKSEMQLKQGLAEALSMLAARSDAAASREDMKVVDERRAPPEKPSRDREAPSPSNLPSPLAGATGETRQASSPSTSRQATSPGTSPEKEGASEDTRPGRDAVSHDKCSVDSSPQQASPGGSKIEDALRAAVQNLQEHGDADGVAIAEKIFRTMRSGPRLRRSAATPSRRTEK